MLQINRGIYFEEEKVILIVWRLSFTTNFFLCFEIECWILFCRVVLKIRFRPTKSVYAYMRDLSHLNIYSFGVLELIAAVNSHVYFLGGLRIASNSQHDLEFSRVH